jgi:hypothetical protein
LGWLRNGEKVQDKAKHEKSFDQRISTTAHSEKWAKSLDPLLGPSNRLIPMGFSRHPALDHGIPQGLSCSFP